MTKRLEGILGEGATYTGDMVFEGRVRIDGTLIGDLRSEDLVEIGPTGRVQGHVTAIQALVAGAVEGTLEARERCTLLETARVRGRLVTPWLDARIGCQIVGELRVERED
jgi:cytoskeletal protein CcmA (bactofilin family)